MSYLRICDLCKEPIKVFDSTRKFKIKTKELKHFADDIDRMAWDSWVTIDVHSECVKKLFKKCKEQKPPVGGSSQQDN